MKNSASDGLTAEQKAELAALAELPEDQIDTSDVPEIGEWDGVQRGLFYRPIKQQVTLRLDADLIEWFKRQGGTPSGRGYQTRINRALREYVAHHTAGEAT